jgi:hypothetical protein
VVSIRYPLLFAVLVLLAGFIALGVHLGTSGEEFSRYNGDWNGTSAFFSSLTVVPQVRESSDLDSGVCSTLLILAPVPGITADDADRSFLSRGNRIILVDEEGYGNAFLASLPSSLRVIPGNLSSVDTAYSTAAMAYAYPSSNDTLLENVSSLILNRPAAVEGGDPLAETSLLSWMDENGNGRPDNGEILRRYTVIAHETVNRGEVVVIADASLFINEMRTENPRFVENVRSIPGLCIDQRASQTTTAEFLPSLLSAIKDTYIIKIIVVAMIMLIGVLIWERRYG